MCLTKTSRFRKTAKEDITVYKVVCKIEDPSKVVSIRQLTTYYLGELHKEVIGTHFFTNSVDEGFHSFNKLNDAEIELSESSFYTGRILCVVECTIPKGSKYYVGTNPGGSDGRVSNQIIINKIL